MTVYTDVYNQPVAVVPTTRLTDDEQAMVGTMTQQLAKAKRINKVKNDYYEAKQRVRQLDIAIPPQLRDVETAVGWPGTVVDVLDERIDLLGYDALGDLMGLDRIYEDNYLGVEASRATCDALVAGVSFVSIG